MLGLLEAVQNILETGDVADLLCKAGKGKEAALVTKLMSLLANVQEGEVTGGGLEDSQLNSFKQWMHDDLAAIKAMLVSKVDQIRTAGKSAIEKVVGDLLVCIAGERHHMEEHSPRWIDLGRHSARKCSHDH